MDFYIDARMLDGETALLFRQALEDGDCGLVSEVSEDGAAKAGLPLDQRCCSAW